MATNPFTLAANKRKRKLSERDEQEQARKKRKRNNNYDNTNNKNRKQVKKKQKISKSNKGFIKIIFTKMYNKIIGPLSLKKQLSTHLNNNNQLQNNENASANLIKQQRIILDSIDDLLTQYELSETSDDDITIIKSSKKGITKKEVLSLSRAKYNDCIQQDKAQENRWFCLSVCNEFATDALVSSLAPGGVDVLAKGGSKKFYGPRVHAHLLGALHRECEKIKAVRDDPNNAHNEWNNCMIKCSRSIEELMTKICLMVYSDAKRQTLSANSYPLRRSIDSMTAHWIALKNDEASAWIPGVKDIQYNNPDYYASIRREIAIEININFVEKPIKKSMDINHQLDGWDRKGEKYNNYAHVAMPDGSNKFIWLGLEEPTEYGAKGEVKCLFSVYARHNIDTDIIRPSSLTYDTPTIHTGKKGGVGALYKKDCKKKGFKFIPVEQLCAGHHGHNYQKDFYRKKRAKNKTFFYPFPPMIESCIDIKMRVAVTIRILCKSNYSSMLMDWSGKNGFSVIQLLTFTTVKEIRLTDHLFTSMREIKRNMIAIMAWSYHLFSTPSIPIALQNVAYELLSLWSHVKVLPKAVYNRKASM